MAGIGHFLGGAAEARDTRLQRALEESRLAADTDFRNQSLGLDRERLSADTSHRQSELGLRRQGLGLQERQFSAQRADMEYTRGQTALAGLVDAMKGTIDANLTAGAQPDQITRLIDPLKTEALSLATKMGLNPNALAGQIDAMLNGATPEDMAAGAGRTAAATQVGQRDALVGAGVEPAAAAATAGIEGGVTALEPTEKFDMERGLRKDFDALTSDFRTVQAAHRRIQTSAAQDSPAGDLSMIFNYMKMLDPGSVVRESEFATAETARPLMERLGISFDTIGAVWEGKRLTPGQRADFVDTADALMKGAVADFDTRRGEYRTIADQYGLDAERVVSSRDFSPQGLPPGVSEDDIQETMRANNLTRAEVLDRLRGLVSERLRFEGAFNDGP